MILDSTLVSLYHNIMNWITTNIRLPEDLYMELKMEAALARRSVAAVIRERIAGKKVAKKTTKRKTDSVLKELEKIAKRNAQVLKGESLTEAVIRLRYEQ